MSINKSHVNMRGAEPLLQLIKVSMGQTLSILYLARDAEVIRNQRTLHFKLHSYIIAYSSDNLQCFSSYRVQ